MNKLQKPCPNISRSGDITASSARSGVVTAELFDAETPNESRTRELKSLQQTAPVNISLARLLNQGPSGPKQIEPSVFKPFKPKRGNTGKNRGKYADLTPYQWYGETSAAPVTFYRSQGGSLYPMGIGMAGQFEAITRALAYGYRL
ncbi:uncharacterized protein PADG_04417 [Paracoccidioides brasiliensis Pb18]|uniref:Uncharacterized protein n=1 Tax=Paracoccidioides brasiliensis (strain Pb18) TaxID=502780 RepID=C1GAY1_PARBD|nr:uncharacterized protein PADG_04417 [Paracoccidioides brasiliensis Pb18]EEH48333.2 hypothetical protein PADG_04417 [Paracoccidioides brasiliensis Pb18]